MTKTWVVCPSLQDMKKGFKPISRLFLHYAPGKIFNTLDSIRFDFDDEVKSMYPLLPPRVLFRTTPTRTNISNLLMA